jgi:hypothetical protein
MFINSQKIHRFVIAGAFATGIVGAGLAASAQTTATPGNLPTNTTSNTVSLSSGSAQSNREAVLNAINADERRVEMRKLGTDL